MNNVSEVITTLIHYNVVLRDSLEYCLKKETYDVRAYKEKKRSVLVEIEQNTPLKSILDHSGENGEKLLKAIREFYDNVYGDESTIIKLADDGLRVDHAQHLAIYEGAITIHNNVEAMIIGIERDAKSKNIDVAEASKVNQAENRLYCGVSFMTLVGDLAKLFGDYNQARREAKGAESPSSRFIGQDIAKLIGYVNAVKANSHLTDNAYKKMEDQVVDLCEMMTGRRDLPAGQNFGDVIKATQTTIGEYVRTVEPEFRSLYIPLINELIAQAKADANKIKPAGTDANIKKEEEPKREGTIELDPVTGLPKA